MGAQPRRVQVLVACFAFISIPCVALAWQTADAQDVWIVLVMALLGCVGMQAKVRRLTEDTDLSLNCIVGLAALALAGPWGAIFVTTVPFVLELRRRDPWVRVFNGSLMILVSGTASLVFYLAGGQWHSWSDATRTQLFLHLALPLMLAHLAQCLVNALLLGAVISTDQKVPYREVVVGILRGGGVAYVGYGIFGLLLAVLWDAAGIGSLAVVLVLAPLFVARWAFAQYADERAAHERTVAALVQAVEAKDHYTRGHSERVAKASVLIARVVGLSQQRTATLHFAGMLHDVGKLGVPTRVLQKTGPLTDEEFATIARHPVRGLEMVREIEFLGEAFEGILHHHERLDGRGYPMGLVGGAIPEFARIIAVADAFDSMTSTRSYREARDVQEAVEELRRCMGTQFDADFVAALEVALERSEWQPTRVQSPLADDPAADSLDHDDPRASLHGAGRRDAGPQ